MDTFMPQQITSNTTQRLATRVKSIVLRAAAASTGGLLALGGYAALSQFDAAMTDGGSTAVAIATPTAHAATATATSTNIDALGDVSGAFMIEPQVSFVAGTDAFRQIAGTSDGPTKQPAAQPAAAQPAAAQPAAAQPAAAQPTAAQPTAAAAETTTDSGDAGATVGATAGAAGSTPTINAAAGWPDDSDDVAPTPSVATTPAPTPAPTVTPKVDPAETARLAAVTWQPATRPSTPTIISSGLTVPGHLELSVNRTAELKTSGKVTRISTGQPEIADVQPFASDIILVTAKKPGTTQVIVWDDKNHSESIDVNVQIPLDQLKLLIAKVAPDANIEVAVAGDNIVLRGQAPNLTTAKQISDLAGAFGKVQNFIEVAGAQTVAVQVQFAEVSRSVTNSLGVNWGFQDGTSIFGSQIGGIGNIGFRSLDGVVNGLSVSDASPTQAEFFGRGQVGNTPFAYFIKALRENNLLRVLQEPTLTTTSGEAASFLAGGQVAVPVPADNGQVAIEYKEFGVRLKLTPVVLGNGKIRLVMEAESSELDYANGTKIQGAAVPGLRTRRVQNTVELGEGQTISVAGLLDDSVVATRQSVPGLGDIPVLGQLFRSTRYQRKETELVVLITPRLAGAMNPDQVQPMPGAGWRHPNELEQFAFGDLGGNKEADAVKDWRKPSSERGLKPGETQRNTSRPQEPAAITQNVTVPTQTPAQLPTNPAPTNNVPTNDLPPPPAFFGEHGFTQAPSAPESTAKTDASPSN